MGEQEREGEIVDDNNILPESVSLSSKSLTSLGAHLTTSTLITTEVSLKRSLSQFAAPCRAESARW